MQQVLLIGIAGVLIGLLLGWVLRRRTPRLAHISHFGASALARVLGAVALGWGAARALEHPDALHIGAAVLFCLLAFWLAVMAALMLYVLATGNTEPPTRAAKIS